MRLKMVQHTSPELRKIESPPIMRTKISVLRLCKELCITGVLVALLACLEVIPTGYAQDIIGEGDRNSWTYMITRPGLRREGEPVSQSGELYYKNAPFPEPLQRPGLRITTNLGTFEYRPSKSPKGEQGWIKLNDTKTIDAPFCKPPVSCEALPPEDLQVGYYGTRIAGGIGEKRKGTPESWVFIVVPGQKRPRVNWVDPDRLKEFLLETRPRR